MYPKTFLFLFFSILVSGCWQVEEDPDRWAGTGIGYKPVYGSPAVGEIKYIASQQIKRPGKIYRYHNYLMVNEFEKGIHVFDNSDPAAPMPLGFIQLLGNNDMAISDDILYADHQGNLVAIDIAVLDDLKLLGTIPLQNWDKGIPPPTGFPFECLDGENRFVIGWKQTEAKNMNCYAIH